MDIWELVGKRALLKVVGAGGVVEYRVLEASPSKKWVKLMDLQGAQCWMSVCDVCLVEELDEIKPIHVRFTEELLGFGRTSHIRSI